MKELRLAALALAAAGTLLAAVYFLSVALAPSPDGVAADKVLPEAAVRRSQIENTIAGTPDIATFFDRLKAALPADYDAALRKAASAPAGLPSDNPDFWLSDAVKIVRQSRGALASKADDDMLSAIFKQQAAVLAALATRDDRLCVDFLYGGASPDFFAFAADNRPLVVALALAGVEAIVDGRTRKTARDAPTDADFQALEDALRAKGLDAAEITALLDGKAPEPPLPDARLCQMGRIYLEALESLPDETRLRLYALAVDLMARS